MRGKRKVDKMAGAFKRPDSPEFEPLKQEEIRGDFSNLVNPTEITPTISRAEILIGEYDTTIAFAKWLEGLLDEDLKNVVVEIDPEEEPETWMAMQRIFSNPSPKITYQSYTQVLAALEEIDSVEGQINNEYAEEEAFIKELSERDDGAILESDSPEMDIPGEDKVSNPPIIRKILFGGQDGK